MMPESQRPSPNSATAAPLDRRLPPKWNRIYVLLAGISLLTVMTSIGLTLRSAGLFSDSTEVSQAWAQRLSLHAELNAMLVAVVVVMGCGAGFQVIKLSGRLAVLSESHAELQRIKQSFEESSRARTDFLAQLSHDIRTPMAGILGMTALALDTELTEEQRSYLGEVKMSADVLLNVIAENCDFPEIDSGPLDLETIDFDLHEVVALALKPQGLRAHEKGVELVCHVRPDVPAALVGDPARLRQILASLVGSALRFTERGEVVLHVQLDGGQLERRQLDRGQLDRKTPQETRLRFAVQDSSGGIAADRRQAIAEALSGNESVQTSPEGRAALSLSLAARLVARMGGSLCMDSVFGEGNTFHFTIAFGAPAANAREPGSLIPGSLKDVRVLVVDDSATQRRVLQELLGHWNMRPTIVSCGADALAAVKAASDQHEPFRLALIDANMPGMNGFEVAREIAREPQLARATILMVDSGNLCAEEASCRDLGLTGWVIKPIQQSDLLNAVTMAVRLSLEFAGQSSPLAKMTPPPAGAGLHILLVEDNRVNQRVAVHMLQKQGHRVEVVATGEECLTALAGQTFDLVLMDLQMPDMGGFQATARIRRDESSTNRHVPIVALTAHAQPGDREKCLAAGMDGYVSKPIQREELISTIDSVLAGAGTVAARAKYELLPQPAGQQARTVASQIAEAAPCATGIA